MCHFNKVEPAAISVLKSFENHTWYLDPSLVVMCLASEDMDHFLEQEKVAKQLANTARLPIGSGRVKAKIPLEEVYLRDSDTPPLLVEFVSHESWLIFDLLGLAGDELVWLTLPRAFWPSFSG